MTILLISLSVYFLLCVAATIAMKLPPQEFLGEVSEIVGNDFNKLGRVLVTISNSANFFLCANVCRNAIAVCAVI